MSLQDVALLSRRWHAVSPSSPLQIPIASRFPSPALLSTPGMQEELIQRLGLRLAGEAEGEGEGGSEWKRAFLKLILQAIEDGFAIRRAAGHSRDVEDEVRGIILLRIQTLMLRFEGNRARDL